MINIRRERSADIQAREALLDEAFGPGRLAKTSERLREGRLPADGLAFVAAERGRVVGTVRLWPVAIGFDRRGLLLGPLAVALEARRQGIGSALVRHALAAARRAGHACVLLVGDAPYYSRFGFSAAKAGALRLPGAYEADRLLGCELAPGALEGAHGLVSATGRQTGRPVAVPPRARGPALPRAA